MVTVNRADSLESRVRLYCLAADFLSQVWTEDFDYEMMEWFFYALPCWDDFCHVLIDVAQNWPPVWRLE